MKNLRTMLFGQLHQPVFVNILANFFHLVLETLLKILPVFQKDTYTHTHTHTYGSTHAHWFVIYFALCWLEWINFLFPKAHKPLLYPSRIWIDSQCGESKKTL